MTTKEEKIIYTARDNSFLDRIVKSCIVEPAECDINKLNAADVTYLLYMIREMTFGPIYKQTMQCPNCNLKQDIEIDITKMKVYVLDYEELTKLDALVLPVSGDVLKLELLSNGDINEINNTIKRITRNGEISDPEGYEYTYRFAKLIKQINGEDINDINNAINYLDNLNLRDFDEIKKVLNDIRIGIDTTNTCVCKKCGEEVEVQGLLVPEFFRSF